MPKGVTYDTREEAEAYIDEVGGGVIYPISDQDGNIIGYEVGQPPMSVDDAIAGARASAKERRADGGIVDELGYMHGGMAHGKRDPIKYAAGGAVRGKRFVGTF